MDESARGAAAAGDAELITAVKAGDLGAYSLLRQRHEIAARVLAAQVTGAQAEAGELAGRALGRLREDIRAGAGPSEAFRPFLYTAVRRAAAGEQAAGTGSPPELPGRWQLFLDPAVGFLARTPMVQAFLELPERFAAALWYADVEPLKPAAAAMLLGLDRRGARALHQQARDALRQAYVRRRLAGLTSADCKAATRQLGGRGTRRPLQDERHLRGCRDCRNAQAELTDLRVSLRGLIAPVFLGAGAPAYLHGPAGKLAAVAGGAGRRRIAAQLPARRVAAAGAGVIVIAAAAAASFALASPGGQPAGRPGGLVAAPGTAPGTASAAPAASDQPSPGRKPSPGHSTSPGGTPGLPSQPGAGEAAAGTRLTSPSTRPLRPGTVLAGLRRDFPDGAAFWPCGNRCRPGHWSWQGDQRRPAPRAWPVSRDWPAAERSSAVRAGESRFRAAGSSRSAGYHRARWHHHTGWYRHR